LLDLLLLLVKLGNDIASIRGGFPTDMLLALFAEMGSWNLEKIAMEDLAAIHVDMLHLGRLAEHREDLVTI